VFDGLGELVLVAEAVLVNDGEAVFVAVGEAVKDGEEVLV
jgi:hypothetical protein